MKRVFGILAVVLISSLAVHADGTSSNETTTATDDTATVKFATVPEGTKITYKNDAGESVTEDVVPGKAYPSDAVVQFGAKGTARLIVVGSGLPTMVRADAGAKFDLSGSSVIGGAVLNVADDSSNVLVRVGGGTWSSVGAGESSGLGTSPDADRQKASERQIAQVPDEPEEEEPIPLRERDEEEEEEPVDDGEPPPDY